MLLSVGVELSGEWDSATIAGWTPGACAWRTRLVTFLFTFTWPHTHTVLPTKAQRHPWLNNGCLWTTALWCWKV